jgi:hypothetical protein
VDELKGKVLENNSMLPSFGWPPTPSNEIARSVAIVFEQSNAGMESPIICPGNSRTKSPISQAKLGIFQEFAGYL